MSPTPVNPTLLWTTRLVILASAVALGIGLVVVGMNLDAESDRVRAFLKDKPLPWKHALLGEESGLARSRKT